MSRPLNSTPAMPTLIFATCTFPIRIPKKAAMHKKIKVDATLSVVNRFFKNSICQSQLYISNVGFRISDFRFQIVARR